MKLLEKGKIDTRKLRLWNKKSQETEELFADGCCGVSDGWKIEAATFLFLIFGQDNFYPRKKTNMTPKKMEDFQILETIISWSPNHGCAGVCGNF